MPSDILVDSNVFIDFLRAGRDPTQEMRNWAGKRFLATCGMVRLEVLRGAHSPKQFARISAFMDTMVIAACALRIHAAVLTSDAHFQQITGLRVLTPPPEWFAVGPVS